MVMLRPFRALRYDGDKVGGLARVVAPPYDVISERERDELYERSEHNVVRLILGREEDRYAAAAAALAAWRGESVLVRDSKPALYYYEEEFALPDGSRHTRRGVLTTVRIEPFSAGVIRPHERTFARAKKDRMALLQACRTNLSPIFGLFAGDPVLLEPLRAARERSAGSELTDGNGWHHRLWVVDDPDVHASVAAALADETVFIADGHHRYETALEYRDFVDPAGDSPAGAPHRFVLMYLTSMREPGLLVLPTHRVLGAGLGIDGADLLARLDPLFTMRTFTRGQLPELRRYLDEAPAEARFAVALRGRDTIVALGLRDPTALDRLAADVTPTVRKLDVTVLDAVVLKGLLNVDTAAAQQTGELTYIHDDGDALAALDAGASVAFLMNAPRLRSVAEVCLSGEVMPQKSTYFYPKLLSGLVLHPLE
jgi:uncharacterized protein (DUF1015 family)